LASASFQQGARHAWSEITHAQDTRRAAAGGGRHVEPEGGSEPFDWKHDGHPIACSVRLYPAATAIRTHARAKLCSASIGIGHRLALKLLTPAAA
jgi:hypothetical protein